jgi:hypothetical protein
MFNLPINYNWKDDPEHLKSKATQTLALSKMPEVARTASGGLNYTYLMEFINAEANLTFINNTTIPQIVRQINQREPLPGSAPMLAINPLSGNYTSITDGSQKTGFHWVIQDQAVLQAEELKAQRKVLGADRARLNQRTPGLVQTGTPIAINRKRANSWSLSGQPPRKLRVAPSSSSSSSSSSGMDRDDDQDSATYSPSMSGGSSSSFTGFSSSSGFPVTPIGGFR